MGAFLEQYGIAIFVLVIVGIMVLAGSGLGHTVEGLVTQEIKRFTDKSVSENKKIVEGTNENVNMITFTIDGVEYQVEEGMTWVEWIEDCGISAGDNGVVWIGGLINEIENGIYINCEGRFYQLHGWNTGLQYTNSVIQDGETYDNGK